MAQTFKRSTAVAGLPTRTRYEELRQMLEERRHVLRSELRGKIRDVRADGSGKLYNVFDEVESSEKDSQEALELALIQMKSETLERVTEALSRLENGSYGHCFECGGDVAEARLRALPFASRCKACEEAREEEQLRERARQRRPLGPLGFERTQ